MKIGIIGGGISGCFCAIKIKEKHPDYVVEIFEHNEKIAKKIYATGNGKCNFANSGSLENKYKNENFVLPILKQYDYQNIVSFFNELGIPNILEDELAYPMSKSAHTVGIMLEKKIQELGIIVHLNSNVTEYKKVSNNQIIFANSTEYKFDKIIIACGGKSSPQLGSDGSIFGILKNHNYKLVEMSPSLCPIKTKENTKMVDGVRSNVAISIRQGEKIIHDEKGELLFKDKGISGIVIFNATKFINETSKSNISIHVDFVPQINTKIDQNDYIKYVNPKLSKYLLENKLDIHDVIFSFKDFYDYSTSQVTSGGVCLCQISSNLESKVENNVFFIGETLDVDAVCGGFNIMWAYASACKVAENI